MGARGASVRFLTAAWRFELVEQKARPEALWTLSRRKLEQLDNPRDRVRRTRKAIAVNRKLFQRRAPTFARRVAQRQGHLDLREISHSLQVIS